MTRWICRLLCLVSRRYKLWAICRVIGIRPHPWQREFALGSPINLPLGRRTGKTMAVMLRLLMAYPNEPFEAGRILRLDPDWMPNNLARVRFYNREYYVLSHACFQAGIPVVLTSRIYQSRNQDGCLEGCGRKKETATSWQSSRR